MAWKVPAQASVAGAPRARRARASMPLRARVISAAARRVNVSSRMRRGSAPRAIEVRHAMRQRVGLAGAGAGDDQQRLRFTVAARAPMHHRLALRRIQLVVHEGSVTRDCTGVQYAEVEGRESRVESFSEQRVERPASSVERSGTRRPRLSTVDFRQLPPLQSIAFADHCVGRAIEPATEILLIRRRCQGPEAGAAVVGEGGQEGAVAG